MEKTNNIITIRKKDITLAHKAFASLMSKTETILNNQASLHPCEFRKLTATALEPIAVEVIQLACEDSPFDANEVKLISGQRFPDIIANQYYGIEVKTTEKDHWTSTGSSIVETSRVELVEDIYMLFGKLGGITPEFKCRPYQDVLYDIAVTHSPRYLIDMEITPEESIFAKMGTTYDTFRKDADSIRLVRNYYRKKAIERNKQEMPWWITSENIEDVRSFNIKLWNTLDSSEKRILQTKCMILFPEALNPKRSLSKYNSTTLWLCSYNQVVNPNIRDLYSAGGSITHVNGKRLKTPVAQVFHIIVDYADEIKSQLSSPTSELLMMIKEFNPALLEGETMYEAWLNICCDFAKTYDVPLRQWIETKPKFLFSR